MVVLFKSVVCKGSLDELILQDLDFSVGLDEALFKFVVLLL